MNDNAKKTLRSILRMYFKISCPIQVKFRIILYISCPLLYKKLRQNALTPYPIGFPEIV